ncbi:hypothetical protein FB2170_00580 [Maribacter sp. HTCC2170]|nr:hypothetical protein FB2170_00580 [Maribacter sp. HTCC2170]
MLYKIFSYLKFIFTATNQHGVHSPFIYNFVTKCLYKKSKFKHPKTFRVLLESCSYFNVKKISIIPKNMHVQSLIKNTYPQIDFNEQPYDIIYMDLPNTKMFNGILKNRLYHNNSMLLVKNIYQSKDSSQSWELIKSNVEITASIDMFHCGALFFRQEQTKEHFKIRI